MASRRRCRGIRRALEDGGATPQDAVDPPRRYPVRSLSEDPRASVRLPHFRCCARCLFISNMVTFFLPNTGSSLLSARISRRFAGFCSSCRLMYSQTLRTTSPRGKGPGPTTAASSLDGCSGCCSPLGLPSALFFDPVGPLLALVGMVVLPATWSRLAAE